MKSLFTFARYPLFILVVLAWSACVHAQDNTSKPSAAEEASKESPGAATENPLRIRAHEDQLGRYSPQA